MFCITRSATNTPNRSRANSLENETNEVNNEERLNQITQLLTDAGFMDNRPTTNSTKPTKVTKIKPIKQ